MSRARLAAVLAAVAVLPALAADTAGGGRSVDRVEWARLHGWTVMLTYRLQERSAGLSTLRSLRLRAAVGGATRLDRSLPIPSMCGDFGCQVFGGSGSLLELADLGGGTPTAVLWLWTGGAHCCSVAETVPLAGGPVRAHDFGNHGASIVRIGAARLFASVDDRFSYLYTSYAASLNPLQLWRFRDTRLVDVTASYPGRIGDDARRLWGYVRELTRAHEEARGAFAAWAADACRLSGRARVEAAARPLVASGAFSPPRNDPFGPVGARFVPRLLADLGRFGYCRTA